MSGRSTWVVFRHLGHGYGVGDGGSESMVCFAGDDRGGGLIAGSLVTNSWCPKEQEP